MLAKELCDLGARVLPSQSNFVLVTLDDARAVHAALAERGIAVRIFEGKKHLEGCLRITLPGEEKSFERLARALSEILAKEVTP